MFSDCLGYWMSFFTSLLDCENCQSSADSVFSNPCHGFCNQRKKSIFRCHGRMCLTLAQSRSIHHRNTLKGGQTLTPASGPDINDFCGQPNGKHFIFIYSVLAYKNNILPDNTWLSWSNSHSVEAEGLKKKKKKVHVLFSLSGLLTLLLRICVLASFQMKPYGGLHKHTHTPEDIWLPQESKWCSLKLNFCHQISKDSVLLIQ